MQPKKKGMETPIVYGIFLILVLFIALHGAVAYKIAQSMVAVGELEKTKTTLTVINLLCDRIATHPTEIIINEYTKQWLLWGGFGWLIVVLMLESNHKNFIQGKEFGTAKWGTLSDIKDLFASTIEASGKTAKSIVSSAVARLAPFRTKAVRRIFSYDTMNLDRVGEEKTAIFVVVPPTDTTFNFIAGMLFTQLFQELQYCATQVHKHDGQRLPVPCRFILDEFANTCTIPNFVKILAYARSFGIGITPILQSLEQIKNMYKDEWGVIVDNCNTLLYLGSITHMDTLEYMSKLLGKGTFDKKTTGRTRGRSGSSSQNFDVIGRELMDSAEIRKLPKKNCLFIVGGRNPFYSEKYNYESHPNYRFTSDANKKFSYHYVPEQPQEEEAKVPHGEEVAVNPSVEAQDATTNIRKVEVDLDPSKQIARLSQGIKEVQPISDELMTVEDGESTEKVEELTLEALLEQKQAEKEKARISVSEEAKLTLEKAKAERIEIEESIINAINRIGRTYRNMEVISDELMTVEDGEQEAVVETAEEKVAEILMEEESLDMVELKDVEDSLADINGILAGMVGFDENPEIDS